MYETGKKEKALLVVVFTQEKDWGIEEISEEFKNLVISAGIEVIDLIFVRMKRPTPSFYIGKGKVYEIAKLAQEKKADVVIFNNNLSFTQQRNLEDILMIKTIDRTQLILDIFAHHAHTQEGSIQVELAQLEYLLPRLKGRGIMLSRLGGGIGTRGPGEKKLEVDRRRIEDRISTLREKLKKIRKHRHLLREKRIKENVKICSLVGYTNAGKTSLLNALVDDLQKTSDSLFTTLDPVSRRLLLSDNLEVVITDTVGFLHKLPHHLIEAFRATLEELKFSDLLLHVVDISSKHFDKLISAVEEVLKELELERKPKILIFNKIDKISPSLLENIKVKYPEAVFVSALKKINLDLLLKKIKETLFLELVYFKLTLPFSLFKILDSLYRHTKVLKVEYYPYKICVWLKAKEEIISSFKKEGVFVEKIEKI
ncbi:MAG: GTPase HflX [Candidatus Omnitrophica bacterium 4484_70.2]|nr:MAG: GTPase HflX [Candidatus Omnitrophica bacterium 4484_70.2]